MEIKKYGQNYAAPENRDQFVDVEKGAVIDKKDIPPLEVIRAMAKRYGMEISDPNKGCQHCYGRGYVGKDIKTQAPIPCTCIYRGRTPKQKQDDAKATQIYGTWNREAKRKMKKVIHNKMSKNSNVAKTLENERAIMEPPSIPQEPLVDILTPTPEQNLPASEAQNG